MKWITVLGLCILVTVSAFANRKVEVTLHSTSVVKKTPSGEKQIIAAEFNAGEPVGTLTVEIRTPEQRESVIARFDTIAQGKSRRYVEIPVIQKPDSAIIVLREGNALISSEKGLLSPPRKWRVYDVQVSHHDLGYADYYHLMRRDVREMGIEMALDFCRRTDAWPITDQFHWTVETSEPMTRFISSQSPEVLHDLSTRIKEGRIALGGLHNSVYTEMVGYESMARLFYTPNRYICDLLGVPPSRTALISDVVGFTRTLPTFLKEADIPYFYHGYNETVNGMYPASANPVFYWKSHDGDTQSMPLFRSFPYYSPDRLTKYDIPEISRLLDKYEQDPLWSYDCLIAEDSYDFSVPHFENVEGIRQWNAQYSNPVLISGTFTMFFDDVMRQAETSKINVYDQDAPDAWADQDATDARLMSDARLLNFALPTAEKLATLAFASGGQGYPWKEIWQAYHKLLAYHEHTDGAFSEEDVTPIPFQKNPRAANANYYESEQVMHKRLVGEAGEFSRAAQSHAIDQFRKLITTVHDTTIAVFNPLNVPRSDVAAFAVSANGTWSVMDNVSGKTVPSQRLPDGKLLFLASNVPSMGYKTFRLVRRAPQVSSGDTHRGGEGMLENKFFTIRIDDSTGAIASIWDKQRKVELVDQSAQYKFNQYIYQRIEEPFSKTPVSHRPHRISQRSFSGPIAWGITTTVKAVGCQSIEQTVILYANSDRIDFVVDLDKSESGRLLKQSTAKNKEALFYVLPFNIPDFTIHHELPGGVVEPLAHQFEGATSSYFGVQHFVDMSNARYGITLSTINAPLVQYGTPRPALWLAPSDAEFSAKKPDKSHVSLYLMNNMFFTNIPLSQPGRVRFAWSVRAHDGDWVTGKAYTFAWETSHPLESVLIAKKHRGTLPSAAQSFLSVDKDNIVCSTFKPAEANGKGFILRLFELAGAPTQVRLRLPIFNTIEHAVETNLLEVDKDVSIPVERGNELTVSMRPFGIKTIRVIPVSQGVLSPPSGVQARARSDREVALSWNRPPGSTPGFYRIYRGATESFAPSLINCIGTTDSLRFTDRPVLNYGGWLDNLIEPEHTYYYRIQAVDRNNCAGSMSTPVKATTLSSFEKNSPPNKVLGLAATSVSPVTPFNYLSLLFYTNCESDVTHYRIYRSDHAGFTPDSSNLLIDIDALQKFTHQTPHAYASVTRALRDYSMMIYPDESARPNRRYYYRVCAVDKAGQAGEFSDEVSAISEITRLTFAGSTFFFDSALVDIRPLLGDGSTIRMTMDGSEPSPSSQIYSAPFTITTPTQIKAALFSPGQQQSTVRGEANFMRALFPPPKYLQPYSDKWPGQGPLNLVDGHRGAAYFDTYFQGFEFNDMDVVVDLGGKKTIHDVRVGMLQDIRAWVFFPEYVEFYASHDGANFEKLATVPTVNENEKKDGVFLKEYSLALDNKTANFIRVKAKNPGMCPPWHIGYEYKGKAWIFADEIGIH
jgi:hypothetical protein